MTSSTCKGCGAPILWRQTKSGAWMPYDADGETVHWASCPQIKRFKKAKA